MGTSRRRRRQRLRAGLRRLARQEVAHDQAQGPAQGCRRALPRHRRGPRGRGDRLAPLRRAQPQGAGPPDGLPRDHPAGDQRRGGQPSPDRHGPRRGAGGAPDPRPALRLRGQPGALAQGDVGAVRRASAVRRDPAGGRPRAGADEVPGGVVLGPRGHLRRRREARPADVPGEAALHRRHPGGARQRLRTGRRAQGRQQGRPPDQVEGGGALRRPARHRLRRALGRVEAVHPQALRAVPHHHAAAGGQPQARVRRLPDDVDRPAALRERPHHLHAHRLHDAVGDGHRGGQGAGARALRPGVPPRHAPDLRLEGEERPGGARGDPASRRLLPYAGPHRPDRGRVPALRADLDAHHRLADEGRGRPVGDDPARRRGRHGRGRRVLGEWPGDHLPRVPEGLRRGPGRRRGRPRTTRRRACPTWPRATR